ncbi:MAG: 30S ribosomal protein S20 [Firmicutes bacterium]|nr:30S ribosomal protein S20 [Bacillota bacterium]MBR3053661.1 30S ribosomal protein S20 [Bacillota bacterium]
MANIKSAKKRVKVIDKKTARNKRVRGHVKEAVRQFEDSVAKGDIEAAQKDLANAEKKLMKGAAKGTLNKKAASRKVSRLAKRLNAAKAEK